MKLYLKFTFGVYLCLLLWMVLFKFTLHPVVFLLETNERSLNLIPFAASSGLPEVLFNLLIFVPFGLLLGSLAKNKAHLLRWVLLVGLFSLGIEISQWIFAIGITDITDLMDNTLGGLLGLLLYKALLKCLGERRSERLVIGLVLILVILVALFFGLHHLRARRATQTARKTSVWQASVSEGPKVCQRVRD